MFDDELAEIYDLLNQRKDYAVEAAAVSGLIRRNNPDAATLLDVGCGTGEHLRYFRASYEVTGVDISPSMVQQAQRKLPGVEVLCADACDLRLGRTFDAVTCLFSSIAFVGGPERVAAAISGMGRHLAPGGILVVVPWLGPDTWRESPPDAGTVRDGDRLLDYRWESKRIGRMVRMDLRIRVNAEEVVREEHELYLISPAEYADAFAAAGLQAELVLAAGGRGVWVGRS
jgi:dTDP-3-amino-3,4,6-trideoxy-alpha-D-glucopyranose N,N-dimethyltransferase